jgi:thiamine biosynthesis lipoprotein
MKRIFIFLLLIISACTFPTEYTETRELMGTVVTITVFSIDVDLATKGIESAFHEIERIDNVFSTYKENSPLYKLNHNNILYSPDEEIVFMIQKSKNYSILTNGSFDITVKPLLDLYSHTYSVLGRAPTEKEIADGLNKVGYNKIHILDDKIILDNTDITLGGIAKGYAIDRAISVLIENNISSALVNAGGDIRVLGGKPNEKWQIALENPRDEQEYIEIIQLDSQAVATSGDYRRYYSSDYSAHHIMDPKTGKSATDLISVTVIADDTLTADAMATSVFVMGPDKGKQLLEDEGLKGILITKYKEIIRVNI